MENTELTLVPERKKRKVWKIILPVLLLLILAAGSAYVVICYSIEGMLITDTITYSDSEVIHAIQSEYYIPNTLAMIIENRILGQTYLPFVENITMSCEDPHILKVKVKEKFRAGVFKYMGKYVYFNEEGIAMESRNHLFEGVPVVTGLEYDKMVLGEKIPVKGNYFRTIVVITKKIVAYGLDISEIHFEGENNITLISGDYEIFLGSTDYLEDKMSKLASVLETVSREKNKGKIDMHLYTDEKEIITFHE